MLGPRYFGFGTRSFNSVHISVEVGAICVLDPSGLFVASVACGALLLQPPSSSRFSPIRNCISRSSNPVCSFTGNPAETRRRLNAHVLQNVSKPHHSREKVMCNRIPRMH